MFKKLLALLIALVLVTTLFAGCSSQKETSNNNSQQNTGENSNSSNEKASNDNKSAENKDLSFAILVKRADEPWFQAEAEGFEEKAAELGVKAIVMDNKLDPNVFLTNMDNAIAQGVSGIATCIPDQKMSKAAVEKAKSANIPIIALDDSLIDENGELLAPLIGMDSRLIGEQIGEWLADYVNKAGWMKDPSKKVAVALMTFDQLTVCKERSIGQRTKLLEKLEGLTEDMVYEINYKNADTNGSFEAMQGLLTAHPDVTNWIVTAVNDEGAVGAVRALEAAGKDKDAVACGLGAGLAKGEFEKENETAFKASAYVDAKGQGIKAVELFYEYAVNGKEIPMQNVSEGIMVTRDNYKEHLK